MSFASKYLKNWPLFVILIFILFRSIYFEGILSRSFNDFDEARYAEIAKNILKTNEWVVSLAGGPDEPRHIVYQVLDNGENLHPYFWKPPLHTILIAIFYHIFGISEGSARAISLFASLIVVILIYFLTQRFVKKRVFVFISTAFFAISSDNSFLSSQATADMLFLMFATLSIWIISLKSRLNFFYSGIFFGLAIMTKSFAGFWILFIVLLYSSLFEKNKFHFKNILYFLTATIFISAPWHILMALQFGSDFYQGYFVNNLIGRATGAQQNVAPLYWYILYFLQNHLIQILICISISIGVIYKILKNRSILSNYKEAFIFTFCWGILILIPFSAMSSKVWWYVFPMWVPLSLYIGISLDILTKNLHYKATNYIVTAFLIFLAIVITQTSIIGKNRNYGTEAIRELGQKNSNLTSFSVVDRPYESALFYFDTGNVKNFDDKTKFLLAPLSREGEYRKVNFIKIDSQNDWAVFKKI